MLNNVQNMRQIKKKPALSAGFCDPAGIIFSTYNQGTIIKCITFVSQLQQPCDFINQIQ